MNAPKADLNRLRIEYAERDRRLAGRTRYSLSNRAHLFTVQQRQRAELDLIGSHLRGPMGDRRILEVGCGRGAVLRSYLGHGARPNRLHGVDLLLYRVNDAHARLPQLPLTCADGQRLPCTTDAFDLVLQYTAFSSILDDAIKISLAHEMLRVVKSDGLIIWYDFWLNPVNPHTRGIRPREIRTLFANCRFEFHRITLAPPITRRMAKRSWRACLLLEKLGLLNTHYLVAIQPRPGKDRKVQTKDRQVQAGENRAIQFDVIT